MAKTEQKNLSGAQNDALDVLDVVSRDSKRGYTLATLAGYAGVGKTTVIARLVAQLCADAYQVIVTAPTHKALAVIGAKIGDELADGVPKPELRTIHSALGLKMIERDDGTLTPAVGGGLAVVADFDVMIVDEASMLSDELFAAIISARRKCRVIFVGDPAQLPPVQSGDARTSAVFDPQRVPVQVRLTEVVRQARGNPIIAFATHLRACIGSGRMPEITEVSDIIERLGGSQLSIVSGAGTHLFIDWCAHAVRDEIDARILAFTNRTVDRYNSGVHFELHPDCAAPFAVGEPAVVQDSNQDLGIKNSDAITITGCMPAEHPSWPRVPAYRLAFTHEGSDGQKTVFIPANNAQFTATVSGLFAEARAAKAIGDRRQADKLVRMAWVLKNSFAHIAHAYAMTVHKSQGSTFDTVLVDWDDVQVAARRDPAQAARLLYVAVTRAASNVCILVS